VAINTFFFKIHNGLLLFDNGSETIDDLLLPFAKKDYSFSNTSCLLPLYFFLFLPSKLRFLALYSFVFLPFKLRF
jgi:hypothetical protein